ncbi:formate dehydrogenase oxidoreductase protein [Klebsiella pneumoniae]|uniref:Formate dehydrogenase oxidoreductase protein n=1 Tax=Klebsiella pneumoniae TaxID=573 RepID=A0A2X3GZU2_KLEPN|nr:formate dehydrogenase oxidoreductase protein [Klebsiella pneumoniae]
MVYDRDSDTLRPVAWEQAFARIGEILRGLQPDEVEFYTSGRASNEAAWLFQLFAREYGTNNFPDCSNMCHESTSVGLPQSIGIGKGTVSLDDFDQTELVISIGHNPGTNHPRMMAPCMSYPAAACRLSFSIRCVNGRWSVLPIRRT